MSWFNWFGKKSKRGEESGEVMAIDDDAQQRGWMSKWKPRGRRERQIAALQDGYREMLGLIRSISAHLDRQEDVQQKLTRVLEEMPEAMQGLKSINKAADQQVEVLNLLRRQLNSSEAHDAKLIQSMSNFNRTLGTLGESSRQSGDLMRRLIERSERRMMFVISVVAALIFIGVGGIAYFSTSGDLQRWINRYLDRAATAPAPAAPVVQPAFTPPRAGTPTILSIGGDGEEDTADSPKRGPFQ